LRFAAAKAKTPFAAITDPVTVQINETIHARAKALLPTGHPVPDAIAILIRETMALLTLARLCAVARCLAQRDRR
jgi:hypothetical protein